MISCSMIFNNLSALIIVNKRYNLNKCNKIFLHACKHRDSRVSICHNFGLQMGEKDFSKSYGITFKWRNS